jgi:hypothetical protein
MRTLLHGYDDQCLEWTVFDVGVPGLCIHRAPSRYGRVLDCWNVSHLASGYSVVRGLPSACMAMRAAKRLGRLAHWRVSESQLNRSALGPRRHAQIRRLIRDLERGRVVNHD